MGYLLPLLDELEQNAYGAGAPSALILTASSEKVIKIHEETLKMAQNTSLKCCAVCDFDAPRHYQGEHLINGAHVVVGTPGRVSHFIKKKEVSPVSRNTSRKFPNKAVGGRGKPLGGTLLLIEAFSASSGFLSPPVHIAWWAHMHHFLSIWSYK